MTLFRAPHALHKHQLLLLETSRPLSLSGYSLDQVKVPCSLLLWSPPQTDKQADRHTHGSLAGQSGVAFAIAHALTRWLPVLQVLAPQAHRPPTHSLPPIGTPGPHAHTHAHRIESLIQERVGKEFNKNLHFTGTRHNHTSIPTSNCLCYRPFLSPYSSFFPTLPQITQILPLFCC